MLRSIGKQSGKSVKSVLWKKRKAAVGRICRNRKVLSLEWKCAGTKVPKIIINDTINLLFNCNQHLVISNHNSFRVLFDKIASVYSLFEKYIYILSLEMISPGNQHCALLYLHTFVPYSSTHYRMSGNVISTPVPPNYQVIPILHSIHVRSYNSIPIHCYSQSPKVLT